MTKRGLTVNIINDLINVDIMNLNVQENDQFTCPSLN